MKSNKKTAQFLNRHNNYSIRKFTIGTASILVGTTLIFGLSNEAHAQSNSSAKVSDKVATEQSASTSQEADSSQQTAASNAQNLSKIKQHLLQRLTLTIIKQILSTQHHRKSKIKQLRKQNLKKKLHKHKQKQKKKQLLIAKKHQKIQMIKRLQKKQMKIKLMIV